MNDITNGRDELARLFSSWNTILETWDDKKSQEINSKYFQSIYQSAQQLITFSEETHTTINEIARILEST